MSGLAQYGTGEESDSVKGRSNGIIMKDFFPLIVLLVIYSSLHVPLSYFSSQKENNLARKQCFHSHRFLGKEHQACFFLTCYLMDDYSPIFFVEASGLVNCGDVYSDAMISLCHYCLIYQCVKDYFVEKLTMDLVFKADFIRV